MFSSSVDVGGGWLGERGILRTSFKFSQRRSRARFEPHQPDDGMASRVKVPKCTPQQVLLKQKRNVRLYGGAFVRQNTSNCTLRRSLQKNSTK
jgi:hypothetical protein